MSVFTPVGREDAARFLDDYAVGSFISLEGIAQGVTNSNFFLTTTSGRYVLTVFEVLKQEEIPFYLLLTHHLYENGVACAAPVARKDSAFDGTVAGKPACLTFCLDGRDTETPDAGQCFHTGAMLAKLHLAGGDFPLHMQNPRYDAWWTQTAERLYPVLCETDRKLLKDEIAFLANHPDHGLPAGIIHADLFKDNVLLNGSHVAGFIDFYYACNGNFMYDLAIAVNDWARTEDNGFDSALSDAFISGYESVRPITPAEKTYLPTARRAACIRFWVSRLLDLHFPQAGELTYTKDPDVFRALLMTLR